MVMLEIASSGIQSVQANHFKRDKPTSSEISGEATSGGSIFLEKVLTLTKLAHILNR
jgi:hypothetical protein